MLVHLSPFWNLTVCFRESTRTTCSSEVRTGPLKTFAYFCKVSSVTWCGRGLTHLRIKTKWSKEKPAQVAGNNVVKLSSKEHALPFSAFNAIPFRWELLTTQNNIITVFNEEIERNQNVRGNIGIIGEGETRVRDGQPLLSVCQGTEFVCWCVLCANWAA